MFKELITKLVANNVFTGLGKIILISTVGITTTTSVAYFYGNISNTLFKSNNIEIDKSNPLLITNQVDQASYLDETITSTSKTVETTQDTRFNDFVVDIVSSASKLITATVYGFDGTIQTTDVNTSASKLITSNVNDVDRTIQTTDVNTSTSKQNKPDSIVTFNLPIEDTNTGSSRTVSVGGTLININREYENEVENENEEDAIEFEDQDDEDEYEDEDEDEDQDDEGEYEDEDED